MSLEYYPENLTSSNICIIKAPDDRLEALWRYAYPFIELGITIDKELRIKDIIDGLIDKSIQLWVVLDDKEIIAAFLTSIERDRGDWVISLYALGGSRVKDWLHHCDRIMELFARAEDAKRVRMCGRPAWKRLLPDSFAITGERRGHNVYERAVS